MRNYVGTAVFITCMVLVLNFMLLAGLTLHYGTQSEAKGKISQIAREIQNSGDGYVLTDQGETLLNGYAWAFLLDAGGNVIWSYDTPEDFPERYTAADVAAFSKWYLDDYPVQCWKQGEKLLVVGEEKDSVWKHQMEFGMPFMKKIGCGDRRSCKRREYSFAGKGHDGRTGRKVKSDIGASGAAESRDRGAGYSADKLDRWGVA